MADNSTCPSLELYLSLNYGLRIGTYYVGTVLYFVFGLLGHLTCLLSFYKQSKTDQAYRYQILLTVNETVEIFAYVLYSTTFFWFSGAGFGGGADWFKSNYFLMWYAARIAIPQVNMLITTSLLLSVAVAADRLFALTKPFLYKGINHKYHQVVAYTSCVILSIGTSIFNCFQFYVLKTENAFYKIELNLPFVMSDIGNILAQIRNALRILVLVALLVCNAILVVLYRKHKNKVSNMTSRGDSKESKEKEAEKTLTLLTIFQCLFNSVSIITLVLFYAAFYFVPSFAACESIIWTPVLDGTLQFLDLADFYTVFAISKKFRQMIFISIPFVGRLFSIFGCKTKQPSTINATSSQTV